MTPEGEFNDEILAETRKAKNGWVIDGSYSNAAVDDLLDTVVILKTPIYITLPRYTKRTFLRFFHKKTLWNGNTAKLSNSIKWLWWTLKTHILRKRVLSAERNGTSSKAKTVIEFKSSKDANRWLSDLQTK